MNYNDYMNLLADYSTEMYEIPSEMISKASRQIELHRILKNELIEDDLLTDFLSEVESSSTRKRTRKGIRLRH